jgi:hypothetical protein
MITSKEYPWKPNPFCTGERGILNLVGGIPWYTYPSEKDESQLGLLFRIYGKIF